MRQPLRISTILLLAGAFSITARDGSGSGGSGSGGSGSGGSGSGGSGSGASGSGASGSGASGSEGSGQEKRAVELPPPKIEIVVRPGKVYRRGETILEAEMTPRRKAIYRWETSGGKLLSNDASLIWWEAPARGEQVTLKVTAKLTGSKKAPIVVERRLRIHRATTEGMIKIPGGVFVMGDQLTDTEHPDFIPTSQNMADKPAHKVRVSTFWIRKQRVTNEEYVEFLASALREELIEVTPHAIMGHQKGGGLVPFLRFSFADVDEETRTFALPRLAKAISFDGEKFHIKKGHERHPVVDITWAGADAYARHIGHRLPNECHWEYAARGTDGRRFPWGNELPTPKHANVNHFYKQKLHPVGTFSPLGDSPFGVQEMVGGVVEWVDDWYDDQYYADRLTDGVLDTPRGPHWGRDKIIRGVGATHALKGIDFEVVPTTFRYAWFLEAPLGDGFANAETGFRTMLE